MKTQTFVHRSRIPASACEVYRWHTEPGALQRLVPPWERAEVVEEGALENGALVILRVGVGPVRLRWISRISNVIPGRQFRDVQIRGPFALWEHTHRMVPDGESACWLEDWVLYTLPFGFPGRLFGDWLVRRKLNRLFEYRHRRALEAFAGNPFPLPGVLLIDCSASEWTRRPRTLIRSVRAREATNPGARP